MRAQLAAFKVAMDKGEPIAVESLKPMLSFTYLLGDSEHAQLGHLVEYAVEQATLDRADEEDNKEGSSSCAAPKQTGRGKTAKGKAKKAATPVKGVPVSGKKRSREQIEHDESRAVDRKMTARAMFGLQ